MQLLLFCEYRYIKTHTHAYKNIFRFANERFVLWVSKSFKFWFLFNFCNYFVWCCWRWWCIKKHKSRPTLPYFAILFLLWNYIGHFLLVNRYSDFSWTLALSDQHGIVISISIVFVRNSCGYISVMFTHLCTCWVYMCRMRYLFCSAVRP